MKPSSGYNYANITFISTAHRENGQCNADELYQIIQKLSPEVIFLEAYNDSYSGLEELAFLNYGQYHERLEIAAIQKYSSNTTFQYVPVCEHSLLDALRRKNKIVSQSIERKQLVDRHESLAGKHGFTFLNSLASINIFEEIRVLESQIIIGSEVEKIFNEAVDAHENPMIRNIYSYCNNNNFSSAIFMCGAAHRKSIIEKIEKSKTENQLNLIWNVFEN